MKQLVFDKMSDLYFKSSHFGLRLGLGLQINLQICGFFEGLFQLEMIIVQAKILLIGQICYKTHRLGPWAQLL